MKPGSRANAFPFAGPIEQTELRAMRIADRERRDRIFGLKPNVFGLKPNVFGLTPNAFGLTPAAWQSAQAPSPSPARIRAARPVIPAG
jgi:hypothetical protein